MNEEEDGKEVFMTDMVQKMVKVALEDLQCERCPFNEWNKNPQMDGLPKEVPECEQECKVFIRTMELVELGMKCEICGVEISEKEFRDGDAYYPQKGMGVHIGRCSDIYLERMR